MLYTDHQIYYQYIKASSHTEETIVLLHGNGFNSSLWGEMTAHLNSRYHVLLIDLYGCGQNTADREVPLNWDLFCNDIYQVIQHLDIEKFHIVGHSFGGSVGIVYTSKYPDQVQSLVLISVVVFYPPNEGKETIKHYVAAVERYGHREMYEKEVIPFLTLLPPEHEYIQGIIRSFREFSKEFYINLFKLQMIDRPLEAVQQLHCPTLLLAGESDHLYLPTLQSMTASYIKRSTLLIMPNAGNALFLDQPLLTAEWIHNFIHKNLGLHDNNPKESRITGHLPGAVNSVVHSIFRHQDNNRSNLQITLFHSFEVNINGNVIREGWDKRYAKNILAYLAFHPVCTREEICDALFPELDIVTALNNLRVYINHLRKLLSLPTGHSLLQTNRKTIHIDANISCDLKEYREELGRIQRIENDEERYLLSKQFIETIWIDNFMSGIYDQWYIDYKHFMEEQFARMSLWIVHWEEKKKDPLGSQFFSKLAEQFLNE